MNGKFDIELDQVLPFLGVSRNFTILFHRTGGDTANSICLKFFTTISIKSKTCFRFVGHSCCCAFSCLGPFASNTIWTQIAHRWSLNGSIVPPPWNLYLTGDILHSTVAQMCVRCISLCHQLIVQVPKPTLRS